MTTRFTDQKGREIDIEVDEDYPDVTAYHKGVKVASLEFTDLNDFELEGTPSQYDYELVAMNTSPAYQMAGIGIKMLDLAVRRYGVFKLPRPWNGEQRFDEMPNPLTDEGAALINAAMRRGILGQAFRNQYGDG